ncbi:MAG TPA: DNA-3-methyladenine glycosylase [Thermoleophilia bacterium]
MLETSFFDRPSDVVAPELIGKIVWRAGVGGGRLTEVEAYLPLGDPACHGARGMTRRNRALFGPPGTIYIYLSYGVHVLLNLVCDVESVASAVLVRAFEPLEPIDLMARNRGLDPRALHLRDLSRGPGRVGQALGLDLSIDGLPLGTASGVALLDDGERPPVGSSSRVGISEGTELQLRFYWEGSGYLSRGGKLRRGDER